MRCGVLWVWVLGCARTGDVPCDGVLDPGEICDDGNASDGDGCDCATRLIAPADHPATSGAPVVIAEDGAWCWFQDERVIQHGDRLLVASISHGGDIQVTSFDPASGERAHSILHARLERDDHDVASLLPLPDGRVAAFYTRHDGFPHLYTRLTASTSATTTWDPVRVTSFPYDVTYTNPFLLGPQGERTHMFLRGIDTNPTLTVSPNFGASWSDGSQLVYSGGSVEHRPYVKYAWDGDATVHLLYTDGHPAEFERNSIYHLSFTGDALFRSDGTKVASLRETDHPSLTPNAGTLVFDGRLLPGGQAWTWDVAIDPAGHPVVVFSTFPDPDRSFFDHRYHHARWDGTSWRHHEIAYGGSGIYVAEGFYSGGIALDPDDPTTVYFASNVEPTTGEPTVSGIFELYRGHTSDDGVTWSITPVTTGSRVDNLRPVVPAGHLEPTTLLWMRGSYDSYLDYRTQVVALLGPADAVASTPASTTAELVALARFDLAATVNGPATPTAPGFVAAVPAAGFAQAESGGIALFISNITGTREAITTDPLYRGLVICDRGGFEPKDKLRVELSGLVPDTDYVVRLHGHDTADAYTRPTLWFRGDARSLDSDNNAAFLAGHRNVNNVTLGEGSTDVLVRADGAGTIALVGRGLDYAGEDRTAILSGLEVLEPPPLASVAAFDVDAAPDANTAPGAASISFDDTVAWSGQATANGLTVAVTSDRIEALRRRKGDDPMLTDFVYGRDQLVVDVSGLEIGRLYAFTVHSTDLEHNQYAASRWRLDEPGREPVVVHGFHMNLHRSDEGASFTFFHRPTTSSFRLRGEDVITSLSSNPSVVLFNGLEVRVAP